MLSYNTIQKQLILPEYGRNIQRMVDHCLTIDDRDERTRCAHSIVGSMARLVPNANSSEDSRRKLWDHLAIMSGFQLDIDWPFEPVKPESLDTKPNPLHYAEGDIRYRHYGRYFDELIARVNDIPEGPEREAYILIVANHAKKLMLAVNPEGVEDEKIFRDLAEMSHGVIRLDPATTHLHEFKQAVAPTTGKKKKKK